MYKRVSNRKETGDVMIDKRIGQRIKECRERIGLTQEQLAEKLNIVPPVLSKWENDKGIPSLFRSIPSYK